MKYAAVTAFSAEGYEMYGRRMVESFLQNGPPNAPLLVYSDTPLSNVEENPRVTYLSLDIEMPEQTEFETRHQSPICHGKFGNLYDYRFDAVKFSHKPAAICAASRRAWDTFQAENLIWFDGDIIFKQPLAEDFLDEKFPEWVHVGRFSRANNHTEAGVLIFKISDTNVRAFIEIFWKTYVSDQVFRLPAWTDCHVLDILTHGATQDGFLRVVNLGDEVSHRTQHPIANSEWFAYLDHLKGDRKQTGASYDSDIVSSGRIEVKL
jgi:hypothetical protein